MCLFAGIAERQQSEMLFTYLQTLKLKFQMLELKMLVLVLTMPKLPCPANSFASAWTDVSQKICLTLKINYFLIILVN